jgi:uncharacterized Zn finger protein
MNEMIFLVKGSSQQPYRVTITTKSGNPTACCTCAAAENGQICKHRLAIFAGSAENIVSGNIDEIPKAAALINGSKLEELLKEVTRLESEIIQLRSRLARTKKSLSKAMRS